jgi:hypothetical protein
VKSAGQTFVVRLPELSDYRVGGAQANGVLSELQRLDLADTEVVVAHVRTHGLGLLWAVVEELDDQERDDVNAGRRHAGVAASLRQPLSCPLPSQLDVLSDLWPSVAVTSNLPHIHDEQVRQTVLHLRSALNGVTNGWRAYGGAPKVRLTLQAGDDGPIAVLGTFSEAAPNEPATTLSPYLRARIEGLLALSVDGPGLTTCDHCRRMFVQVRGGERYSRFCPGYDCASLHRRSTYEVSDYRREYRRRQIALKRLIAKDPSARKSATREFEEWKSHAKQTQPEETTP